MKKIIIFGANSSVAKNFANDLNVKKKFQILGVVRKKNFKSKDFKKILEWDVLNKNISDQTNKEIKRFNPDIIIFSQGANLNDNIYNFSYENLTHLMEVNCFYILKAINSLFKNKLLQKQINFVVISSIWQLVTRANKLSYTLSKSALSGLVRSLSLDFRGGGHSINSILPGVILNKMTKKNLLLSQIKKIKKDTPSNRLVTHKDLNEVIISLSLAKSINGQTIIVDNNYSYAKTF
jgi:NAD(P)-dependent dehydrogenase (short-subunit alcohol dehydrogenase family)